MAVIIFGSHMFRYPLGGMQSWSLQYMLGLEKLGHEVYFFEKYGYENSCYDPEKETMSNDCSYGLKKGSAFLEQYGFADHWCFVSFGDIYNGLSKSKVTEVFKSADLYIDMGAYGAWSEESEAVPLRILIEGEPGYVQIKMVKKIEEGIPPPQYHRYFTNGFNIGLENNEVPTAGINWEHLFHPVNTDLFPVTPPVDAAPYTSLMNWRSQSPVEFNGKTYGQKDVEFLKFIELPLKSPSPMELALGGGAGKHDMPHAMMKENKWIIKNSRKATIDFDTYRQYITCSRGEFRVCKNVYVALNTGWFSDVSACYLASGRPVVMQETGFSDHLPVGKGLFAVNNTEEAAEAMNVIESDYSKHSAVAREIAEEYLEGKKVMKEFMSKLGF